MVDAIQANSVVSATDEIGQVKATDNANSKTAQEMGISNLEASEARHTIANASNVANTLAYSGNFDESVSNEKYNSEVNKERTDELQQLISSSDLGTGEAISQSTSSDANIVVKDNNGYESIVDSKVFSEEHSIAQDKAAGVLQDENDISQQDLLNQNALHQQAQQRGDSVNFENQRAYLDNNNSDTASKVSAANNNRIALSSGDVEKIHNEGGMSDKNKNVIGENGANATITLDHDGEPLNSVYNTGTSASRDDNSSISRVDSVHVRSEADGATISNELRDPKNGGFIMDGVYSSDANRGLFTDSVADQIGQYNESTVVASEEVFVRNSAYLNAGGSLDAGITTPFGGAKATVATGVNNETGVSGQTSDTERVDSHKALAEQWVDEARDYGRESVETYMDSGLPLDPDVMHNMEMQASASFMHDRIEAMRLAEQERMFDIVNGENAPLAPGSDSFERNSTQQEGSKKKVKDPDYL